MNHVTTLGIDLAKNVFQLHGVNKHGKKVLTKRVSRNELMTEVAKLPPCLIGIEACGSSHHWARKFMEAGHTVKIMAPQFVKPYVKTNKNDANDAEAIAEAVMRPNMRFVSIKSLEQQDMTLIHTVRKQAIKFRTAQGNGIRGLLAEYGIVIPQGIRHIRQNLPNIIDDMANSLTSKAREYFRILYADFIALDDKVEKYDTEIKRIAREDERCRRLQKIDGVGPITATAIVAAIGDGKAFENGRALSAWLGLVPKQHSSGNKTRLLGISKRGDTYLRTLLIHGGRSVVMNCGKKQDPRSQWILSKMQESSVNNAAVAVANKNARIIWAMLTRGEEYCPAVRVAIKGANSL